MSASPYNAVEYLRRLSAVSALVSYGSVLLGFRSLTSTQEREDIRKLIQEIAVQAKLARPLRRRKSISRTYSQMQNRLDALVEMIEGQFTSGQTVPGQRLAKQYADRFGEQGWTDRAEDNEQIVSRLINQALLVSGADSTFCFYVCAETAQLVWLAYCTDAVEKDQVVREISFSPETQQVAIGILSYFSVILRQKLPETKATVSIRQEDERISLIITHLDGRKEEISKLLSDYEMVVTGRSPPDILLSDPIQIAALRQKLELSALELRQTREILMLERSASNSRISSIESELTYLRTQLTLALTNERDARSQIEKVLLSLIESPLQEKLHDHIARLTDAILVRDSSSATRELGEIRDIEPDAFGEVHKFLYSNAFAGIVGNAAYDWLKVLWPILPK